MRLLIVQRTVQDLRHRGFVQFQMSDIRVRRVGMGDGAVVWSGRDGRLQCDYRNIILLRCYGDEWGLVDYGATR